MALSDTASTNPPCSPMVVNGSDHKLAEAPTNTRKRSPNTSVNLESCAVGGRTPKDEGWSWMILLSSFTLHTIAIGVCFSSGLFLVEFMECFDAQRSETAWISSMEIGVAYLIGAPVSGWISQRWSHRTSIVSGGLLISAGMLASSFATGIVFLYFSCGLLAGLGVGLVYSPAIGVVGLYFERRLPLALGVVMAGGGAGAMVFSVLFSALIECFQWRGALLVTSAVVLNCCAAGALMFPPTFWDGPREPWRHTQTGRCYKNCLAWLHRCSTKSPIKLTPSLLILPPSSHPLDYSLPAAPPPPPLPLPPPCPPSSSSLAELLSDVHFVLFFLNSVLMCAGTTAVFFLLVDYLESCGLARDLAARLLSVVGLSSAIGRFAMAALMTWLQDCRVDALHLYLGSTVAAAGTVLAMPVSGETFGGLVVLCAAFGCAYGGICSASPVVVSEFFGAERLTTVYAYTLVASGVGSLLGPPFAGWVYELRAGYRLPFLLNGSFIVLSFLVLLPLVCLSVCRWRRHARRRQSALLREAVAVMDSAQV